MGEQRLLATVSNVMNTPLLCDSSLHASQLHTASLQTHDFRVTMDCLNELQLYVRNGEEGTVERWRDAVQDIVGR